ncbi:MAG: hypothetical protein GEU28_13535 [Dehalococcoidia bacterium]|nr:hypothetical protein [Dehalococcoidia bacterium]MQA01161.1 hypothetical protein [Dehalococcoidia bacterium]
MAEPPADADDDTSARPSTPRWVKVFGVIALVLVLLVVGVLLFGGGEHGPGRHGPSGGTGGQTAPSSAIEGTPPGGGAGNASAGVEDGVELVVTAQRSGGSN